MATIPTNKRKALVLKQMPSLDEIISAAAILRHYGEQELPVFASNPGPVDKVFQVLGLAQRAKATVPPGKITLSFKRPQNSVESVAWESQPEFVNIFITMQTGSLNLDDLKLSKEESKFDLLLLPGLGDLSELGEFYEENKELFLHSELVSLGRELNLSDEFQFDSVFSENFTTVSEQVFTSLDGQLSRDIAQLLLLGILAGTERFARPLASGETMIVLKKLLDLGADNTTAVKLLTQLEHAQ